jgi:hypothetical protein
VADNKLSICGNRTVYKFIIIFIVEKLKPIIICYKVCVTQVLNRTHYAFTDLSSHFLFDDFRILVQYVCRYAQLELFLNETFENPMEL